MKAYFSSLLNIWLTNVKDSFVCVFYYVRIIINKKKIIRLYIEKQMTQDSSLRNTH